MNRAKPTAVRRPSAAAKPSGARLLPAAGGGRRGRSSSPATLVRGGSLSPREGWDSGDSLQDTACLVLHPRQ